jgi:hypothetical protein
MHNDSDPEVEFRSGEASQGWVTRGEPDRAFADANARANIASVHTNTYS